MSDGCTPGQLQVLAVCRTLSGMGMVLIHNGLFLVSALTCQCAAGEYLSDETTVLGIRAFGQEVLPAVHRSMYRQVTVSMIKDLTWGAHKLLLVQASHGGHEE